MLLRNRVVVVVAGLTLAGLGLAGCSDSDGGSAAGDRLQVVASFYPLAELAERVGGNEVKVTNLTAAGVEPHDLELTSRQVDDLLDADVLLYLGEDFQPAVADIAGRRDGPSLDLLEHVEIEAAASDPHFWLDPQRMAAAADAVADELAGRAPGDASAIRANATSYKEGLADLDDALATGLATCQRRLIVTAHDAFGYLATRYGLEQLAIAGLSPEAEPDAGRLSELAEAIETNGVTTVFFEELVSPDVAQALARETGAATAVLNPIEALTEEEESQGKDYAAVMRDNLAALRQALGCS